MKWMNSHVLLSQCQGLSPSRSLSKVSADTQSVAGPVPLMVMAATRKLYSVPRSSPTRHGAIPRDPWVQQFLQTISPAIPRDPSAQQFPQIHQPRNSYRSSAQQFPQILIKSQEPWITQPSTPASPTVSALERTVRASLQPCFNLGLLIRLIH